MTTDHDDDIRLPGRLGHLASREDPKTFRMASFLRPADLPPAPDAVDNTAKLVAPLRMLGNDAAGDCELVAAANAVQVWTAANGAEQLVQPADVISAYAAISGYSPKTGANDDGCQTIDVLNYWRRKGFGRKGAHKILAFVRLDNRDHDQIRMGVNLFDSVHCALDLPRSASAQFAKRQEWAPVPMIKGGSRGSWGGHAVCVPAYSPDGLTALTWAREQPMSWKFWDAYGAEVWGVVTTDQVAAGGLDARGFDLARLQAALAGLAAGATRS